MKEILDRVPTQANRYLVTPEGGGTPFYATITRADEPVEAGTPVGRALFMTLQGMEASSITFNPDGSVTQIFDTGTLTITFPNSTTIIERFVGEKYTVTKTTTFNLDGSITEVIS